MVACREKSTAGWLYSMGASCRPLKKQNGPAFLPARIETAI
jgi:hypothetical protein